MKKSFVFSLPCLFICALLAVAGCESTKQEEEQFAIRIVLQTKKGESPIELAYDSAVAYPVIVKKLQTAKVIPTAKASTSSLTEGKYIVTFERYGTILKSYEVFNTENAYDTIEQKVLRTDVRIELHELYKTYKENNGEQVFSLSSYL